MLGIVQDALDLHQIVRFAEITQVMSILLIIILAQLLAPQNTLMIQIFVVLVMLYASRAAVCHLLVRLA